MTVPTVLRHKMRSRVPTCPRCDTKIPPEALNIADGNARCEKCGMLSGLSELKVHVEPVKKSVEQPPRGCSIRFKGDRCILRARLGQWSWRFQIMVVCLISKLVIGFFFINELHLLWESLLGPLPEWVTVPEVKIELPSLVLLPLLAMDIWLMMLAWSLIVGRNTVVIGPDLATVSIQFFPFRWTRRFDPNAVQRVTIEESSAQDSMTTGYCIEIQANRVVRFGRLLTAERMEWMYAVVSQVLYSMSPREGDPIQR